MLETLRHYIKPTQFPRAILFAPVVLADSRQNDDGEPDEEMEEAEPYPSSDDEVPETMAPGADDGGDLGSADDCDDDAED